MAFIKALSRAARRVEKEVKAFRAVQAVNCGHERVLVRIVDRQVRRIWAALQPSRVIGDCVATSMGRERR